MIDTKDVLTLSDSNRYVVVSKTMQDDVIYYYLVDIKDNSNIKFCYENKTESQIELVEITDSDLVKNLILLFADSINNEFK